MRRGTASGCHPPGASSSFTTRPNIGPLICLARWHRQGPAVSRHKGLATYPLAEPLRSSRACAHDEECVSSVVGSVLMLVITVTVFSALSVGLLAYFDAQDRPPRAEIVALRGDDTLILVHRGGTPLELTNGRLLLNVEGLGEQEVSLGAFADQTADGTHWRIGESLCIVGPPPVDPLEPGCFEEAPAEVHGVLVIHTERVLFEEGVRA